jgi:beta-lysine N6-acetyltransferase
MIEWKEETEIKIMNAIIVKIGDSIVRHGKYNDRIYLMKLSKNDCPDIIHELDKMAYKEGYSKIFAKVPASEKHEFAENGFIVEAQIPRFFCEREDVYFMGKYFAISRKLDDRIEEINKILDAARINPIEKRIFSLPGEFIFRICDKTKTNQIAGLYNEVFETYPFPIYEPDYILKSMDLDVIYFSISKNYNIIALSSSEMDMDAWAVEMTDFATLPEYHGNGFASYLLHKMEEEMRKKGMKTAYTICRAFSYGINMVFAKMEYKYAGTLMNNTNISGNLESMNVWYKFL